MMLSLEILAAISGLISVLLLTKQNIWAWPTGLLSVGAATIVFYDSFLYSDMLLHIYYMGMNIYGWIHWSRKSRTELPLPVTTISAWHNVKWVLISLIGTVLWGWTMSVNTDASFPYGDEFTTVASLVAMWLMAQKRLENWAYWFVIDIVAISIYALKGLYLFSGQYLVFLILCVLGYRDWKRSMSSNLNVAGVSPTNSPG